MLSISPPMKGVGHSEYYLKLARQDYYNSQGTEPGRWFGTGAERLGLRGTVATKAYENSLWGRSADGKHRLVQNADDPDRQTAWDLTLSAPKSVSVLWASAPEDVRRAIERAHRHAVETALRFIEEAAGMTRRGKAGAWREHVDLVFATFFHICSRAFDMQIHSHCLLINLGVRQDDTTGSLWSRDVFRAKMTAGAIYQVQFAADLGQDLGLAIAPDRIGFQIEGVPKTLCRANSKRRQAIEAAMDERGATDAVSAKTATLETRPRKEAISRAELFARWRATCEAQGWTAAHAARLVGNSRTQPCSRQTLEKAFRQAVAALPEKARTPGRLRGLAAGLAVKLAADAETVRPILMRLLANQWGQPFSQQAQAERTDTQRHELANAHPNKTARQVHGDHEPKQPSAAPGGHSSARTSGQERSEPGPANATWTTNQEKRSSAQDPPETKVRGEGFDSTREQRGPNQSNTHAHEHAEQHYHQSEPDDEGIDRERGDHERSREEGQDSRRTGTHHRAKRQHAKRSQPGWDARLRMELDPRNARTEAQRKKLFFKWKDLVLEKGLPKSFPAERFVLPRRQRRRNAKFIQALEKKVRQLPTAEQTGSRLIWHAVKLACEHQADTRTLARALQDLDVGADHGWVHVKWQRLFPKAPGWSPVSHWKAPVIVIGGPRKRYRKWGEIVWKKNLIFCDLRVQKRRLFPKAPRWSPVHGLEIPALRLAKKTPKSEQVVRPTVRPKQNEHGHQQSH